MLQPQEVEVPSSSGEGVYFVTTPTLYTDGICDPECKGYMYRGTCRHIDQALNEAVCFYGTNDLKITTCPHCGEELLDAVIPNSN